MCTPDPSGLFSDREVAIGVWMGIALVYMAIGEKRRASLVQVIGSVLRWKLVVPALVMALYVAALVHALAAAGWWTPDELKDTILWFVFSGIVILFSAIGNAPSKRGFWRRLVTDQLKVAVIIEWAVNAYSFPLWGELLGFPAIAFLVILDAYAGVDAKYRKRPEFARMGKVARFLLGILALVLLIFTIREIAAHFCWAHRWAAARAVSLAPLLSLAIIPLAYVMGLWSTYESLMMRLRFPIDHPKDPGVSAYAARRIFWWGRFNPRRIEQFWRIYWGAMLRVRTRSDVDAVVRLWQAGRRWSPSSSDEPR
jgi:hypothetical protein